MRQGDALARVVAITGLEPERAVVAVDAATTGLIVALDDWSHAPGGRDDLAEMVGEDDGSIVADVGGFLAGGKQAYGSSQLDRVLGDSRSDFALDVAAAGGIEPPAVRKLLPMLMPVVVGVIAKLSADRRLDGKGMAAFVAAERSTFEVIAASHDDGANDRPRVSRGPLDAGIGTIVRWSLAGAVGVVALAWALSALGTLLPA